MFQLNIIIIALLALLISAIITRFLISWVISASLKRGITTTDAHKRNTPILAEPGGLAPLFGFMFTILVIVFGWEFITVDSQIFEPLLAGVLSVVIAGLIGFLDDVFKIRWRDKILLGFLPAIPLMALKVGTSTIDLPIVGILDLGPLYSWVLIPLAVNFAFNSFNMLAGFNGLEAGNGSISLGIILLVALLVDNPIVTLFSASLLGGFIVLLKFNWFPAKILIGDTGTLTLGTGIIVALFLGNMDRLALGLFGIHFLNFLLFLGYIYTHQTAKLAKIDKDGYIEAPCPYTVYWIFPFYFKNVDERKNVILILITHSVIALGVLLLSLPAFA